MLLLKAFLKVFACYVLQDAEFKTHTVHYFPNRYVNAFALFQVAGGCLDNSTIYRTIEVRSKKCSQLFVTGISTIQKEYLYLERMLRQATVADFRNCSDSDYSEIQIMNF